MHGAKYIVVDDNSGREYLYILPIGMSHADMYQMVISWYPGLKIQSAGFMNENHNCYGKSVSLRIASNPERDSNLAKAMFT